MAQVDKPRHRDGYTRAETAQVEAACLSVAITLGPLMDELCIVGGLVPTLVIDRQLATDGNGTAHHPGTLDLDVGLALGLLDQRPTVLDGRTLSGERAIRTVSVCGPGAFTVLKALASGDRGEPKDAFDLVYTLRRWHGGPAAIAERLAVHAKRHATVVGAALDVLARDFATIDMLGPSRVAEFERATGALRDEVTADAHGDVDDLLAACGAHGLGPRRS